jgi:hypothetical protein
MRELASWICAVLLPLGLLLGLEQAIHTVRPDFGAAMRATQLDSATVEHRNVVTATGPELAQGTFLPAPRPALVVRVLTLDISDPWHPVPLTLRPPAWSPTLQADAVALGDYASALRGYAQDEFRSSAEPRSETPSDHDFAVAISDHYAYVAAGDAGLRILDYTALASERQEYLFATPGAAEAVLVRGERAHIVVLQSVPAYSGYD